MAKDGHRHHRVSSDDLNWALLLPGGALVVLLLYFLHTFVLARNNVLFGVVVAVLALVLLWNLIRTKAL